MDNLFEEIASRSKMIEKFATDVIGEDEIIKYTTSMTTQQYNSLKNRMKRDEPVISHWLRLPVEPVDPYEEGKIHLCSATHQKCHHFK